MFEQVIPKNSGYLLAKRVFDTSAAAIGLVVLIPLFVLIGVLIKVFSPGPVSGRPMSPGAP